MEPLDRPRASERQRLHQHLRWHVVPLRDTKTMRHILSMRVSASKTRIRFAGLLCAFLTVTGASAQFADWTTGGFDAQRSNWQRSDTKISLEAMRKPGF